ncbi:hypothetical protein SAMN03159338_3058 [Sphingomonas sp. NFR04]|uniref:hypothetical protein n=1 Tax=Sphingomonas sp. NFR04 TaxID=1566283 RepID=UPI0008E1A7F6|nr:hypothetical protein [Sphingomonas sp. NFR04]SFK03261.1 hypothetical protein SAMN03159338_3058 [Sphingomonas sp. NFR04]
MRIVENFASKGWQEAAVQRWSAYKAGVDRAPEDVLWGACADYTQVDDGAWIQDLIRSYPRDLTVSAAQLHAEIYGIDLLGEYCLVTANLFLKEVCLVPRDDFITAIDAYNALRSDDSSPGFALTIYDLPTRIDWISAHSMHMETAWISRACEKAGHGTRLRATKTDDNILLLKTNMGAGHGGKSGRCESLRGYADEMAFVLWQLGVEG